MAQCPLCLKNECIFNLVGDRYAQCPNCALRYLAPQYRLNPELEKERYELHDQDINDAGYREYLRPLSEAIVKRISPPASGLDYGAGPLGILGALLTERGYDISRFDPFYANFPERLKRAYDFVVAAEVVEHFYFPNQEFQRLRFLTKDRGTLGIMTKLYDGIDFDHWYYRREPSHVVFYCEKTIRWITHHFHWSKFEIIGDRTILFS